MFYTIRNDGQASFEDALRRLRSSAAFPREPDAPHATRLARCDSGQTDLTAGISTFFRSFGRRADVPTAHSRGAVHPENRREGALAATADPSAPLATSLLRQSLAERDLVVKHMVHKLSLPELSTSLMGQYWDGQGRPVLVIEVRSSALGLSPRTRHCCVCFSRPAPALRALWHIVATIALLPRSRAHAQLWCQHAALRRRTYAACR